MSDLVAFFTADHRACDTLWAAVETAIDGGDATAVAAAFAEFDRATRRHLHWEEQVLFPAFEEATGMTHGPTMVMRGEHDQMRGMLTQMQAALDAGDPDLLADHGDTLLMLTQQHNSKEEQMLYPMADRAVGPSWAQLRARIEQL